MQILGRFDVFVQAAAPAAGAGAGLERFWLELILEKGGCFRRFWRCSCKQKGFCLTNQTDRFLKAAWLLNAKDIHRRVRGGRREKNEGPGSRGKGKDSRHNPAEEQCRSGGHTCACLRRQWRRQCRQRSTKEVIRKEHYRMDFFYLSWIGCPPQPSKGR